MASAIMKDSSYPWLSDTHTGAFDEVEVQRRYLDKYLPGVFSITDGEERVWCWLHGR